MMAALGAKALATSSAAHAFTLGRPDLGGVSRDEALAHAEAIVAATPLPVSGDFENGFADDPDGVAETVRLAGGVGLSGCSIEDTQMVAGTPAYAADLAAERIRAAVAAARALARPFVLCARADGVMNGSYDLAEGIRRLQAFEAAGADVLYLPVPPGRVELQAVLAAVTKPVNALAAGPLRDLTVAELAALGVRRISHGVADCKVDPCGDPQRGDSDAGGRVFRAAAAGSTRGTGSTRCWRGARTPGGRAGGQPRTPGVFEPKRNMNDAGEER
jgi:2-methylisocitrate lyase-like PEP mutase family enzyme